MKPNIVLSVLIIGVWIAEVCILATNLRLGVVLAPPLVLGTLGAFTD